MQSDRPGQHEPRHIAKRFERMLPDPVPADILEFFARRRFAEHIGAVAEEEPGIEPPVRVRRGDRPPDIGQQIQCRDETAFAIGSFDLPGGRRRRVRPSRSAHQHPDLFPGLAQRRTGRARETEPQRIATRFDTPGDPVGRIDRTARKDVHPGHEFDMQRSAAREDFEILALAAQQNQRSRITRPHHRFTRASRHLHNIIHEKWKDKIRLDRDQCRRL